MTVTRFILFSALVLTVAIATKVKREESNADEYMDKLLVNVRALILEKGMDPYTAVDYRFLNVHLTGQLHGMGTLRRAGPTNLHFNQQDENIVVDGVFGASELKVDLQWTTNLGFMSFNGYVTGTTTDSFTNVTLRADVNTKKVRLTKFKVGKVGKITIETKTLPIPLWDRVLGIISSAVTNLFRNLTAKLLEGPIQGFVQATIDKIGTEGLVELEL